MGDINVDGLRTHELPPFEDGGLWKSPFNEDGWREFSVGTCHGAYRLDVAGYEILAIYNDKPGNGHVEAALAWFYGMCKRDRKPLLIRECLSAKFAAKLVKLGFTYKTDVDLIKRF